MVEHRGFIKKLVFPVETLPVNLVYTADRFLPIKVRAFLDFAAPRLKRVLAELKTPDRQTER